ncbi:DUF488 family protein [Pseudoteredinibacter isoporae]|uniref:Uncharacterized protein (DUF488 family) n=1 Tax=Pseudoteredinibacter isoporae TaxID=570281 RepID=A0A7X0JVV6_9GAMM|nr:DUF488 domain-containing protein [Pseudoteredinibacter isoporae]MBB6523220.1 uncharacterized protein (DUF488 family) [Pseudoteredinibacter isoporae]NHO88737.1 DUF488 domain-containing protein [Pseudoteredinibacter isoporae]NIB22572.1 DUF488 domain-containing protein [Pseudoteredinibacter isoporae]
MATIYSIGYATKSYSSFLEQLQCYQINALVDVRSVPFSARFKEYDQPNLQRTLRAENIHYIYMGDLLGPRSKDPAHYSENRQIDFDKLKQSHLFLQGIERLKQGLEKEYTIAMMCAEKDPASCHRSLLIAKFIEEQIDWSVEHILHDGELENQQALMNRLVEDQGLCCDMLSDEATITRQAYEAQCRAVNYKRPE